MNEFPNTRSACLLVKLFLNNRALQTGELGFVTASFVNEMKHISYSWFN